MQRTPFPRGYVDPRRINNFLDTCAFDPKYSPEHEAAQKILQLGNESTVQLLLTHSNQKEIEHPNTPAEVKALAGEMNYTLEVHLTDEEPSRKVKLHEALTGNGNPEKYKQDALHVFEAGRYGGYFITTDERILAKRSELKAIGAGEIFRPSEWLKVFAGAADA